MGGSAETDAGDEDDARGDDTHEDVVDYPPDPPLVEWLKGFVRTVQLAAFLALVLAPLVAGFLVPLGPPAYHVEVAAVNPADVVDAPGARAYEDLDPASRAVFDRVLVDGDNAIDYRTADRPPILDGESATVVRDGLAFRLTVEDRPPPLRFPAIVAGVLGSTFAAILGYHVTEWDPV